ncbi:hypothetical protein TNCT_146381 [Trichonephila clavata]|uniref:Uncharacterized protein n=1 Tax=Trichonephila clavata TaxID=2740835 RepID=A0A8X6LPD7_TRICU|nr:hypothetical protein TNCT_146381 [Trichonephila clavata]
MISHVKSHHGDVTWYQSLPTVLLGLCTTIHDDLKATPAELVFGENLHLPGDFLDDSKLASPSSFVQQPSTYVLFYQLIIQKRSLLFSVILQHVLAYLSVLIPSKLHYGHLTKDHTRCDMQSILTSASKEFLRQSL